MNLIASLDIVQELRNEISQFKEILAKDRKAWEELHRGLIEAIKTKELDLQLAEDTTRKIALVEFDANGEKQLSGGVRIRIKSSLYYDQHTAMEWCEKNMPVAFERIWSKKTFEEYAKKHELSFVKVEQIPEATLPREIVIGEEQR